MNPIILDKVRGCMLGGAVGDALGYPVMNLNIDDIRKEHGENGISEYLLDENGKAGIIRYNTVIVIYCKWNFIRKDKSL